MFHVKSNPNYYTRLTSRTKRLTQRQYLILAGVSCCCGWSTAWNRYRVNFRCSVTRLALITDKHFLFPESLLPVGVFGVLSYSVHPCEDTPCYILHEQQHTISMWNNVQKRTHVLLLNTPYSHTYSCCASIVRNGQTTRVTFTCVTRGGLVQSITQGWICIWFHFCTAIRDCWVGGLNAHSVFMNTLYRSFMHIKNKSDRTDTSTLRLG
jgi:hypothetical protein